MHAIDFSCDIGTPLLAVGNGTVVQSKDSNTLTGIAVSNLFEWNSILIQLDDTGDNDGEAKEPEGFTLFGESSTKSGGSTTDGPLFVEYVHIESACVKAGDRVVRGQVIGTSGSVGFSPEPHLHFSAFRSSAPDAPTVRVRFAPSEPGGKPFVPRAGNWYNESGLVGSPAENA